VLPSNCKTAKAVAILLIIGSVTNRTVAEGRPHAARGQHDAAAPAGSSDVEAGLRRSPCPAGKLVEVRERCVLERGIGEVSSDCRLSAVSFWQETCAARLYPIIAEPLDIFLQCFGTAFLDDQVVIDPARALTQNVIIRQGEKVIAVSSIPVSDHFRKIIAVTPQRVSVNISLPPFEFRSIGSLYGRRGLILGSLLRLSDRKWDKNRSKQEIGDHKMEKRMHALIPPNCCLAFNIKDNERVGGCPITVAA
jgi:hypothetical protein